MNPLERFSPTTRAWFESAFEAPTEPQTGAWDAIADGKHTLVVAPTGSGKTLAAFLWAIDKLAGEPKPDDPKKRCRVVYISPLKALAVDVERNLRAPLAGIKHAAARQGEAPPDISVAVRSGDTPADERRRFASKPADILITTPESLFLILTSQARESLTGVETVILDEVHAVAGNKRGAHLGVTLERLDALLPKPAQRIGLSATVRPIEEVARFLAPNDDVHVVAPETHKEIRVDVVVPVEDMTAPGDPDADDPQERQSMWPAVEERISALIENHRSTIVFTNSRRLAERLTTKLNDLAAERAEAHGEIPKLVARAHHGSVSREQRAEIEGALKSGQLPAVVATSSLELGIDMGAVDLVVQVEPPPSVASGLQRIGRAGHHVGAPSTGVVFPKHRGELVPAAVVSERMQARQIEEIRSLRNPLDVLAQQIVAMVSVDEWHYDDLATLIRRAAPFKELPTSAYDATLDMLAGRYPSDEFAELRPRIVWDRSTGSLTARPGAQRLAVTSGGTIPDRGLFGVFLVGERASRVGELDEEMVYESRVGDVFTLGSSSWRIEEITHDRVLVSPAPGQPGRVPFWHGDAPGRPLELGRAIGSFLRELSSLDEVAAVQRATRAGFDNNAAANLIAYLKEQAAATHRLPDDRTVVVERFRDELGDWRLAVHSPFGAQVNAPWAIAIAARLRESSGVDVQHMYTDDGIILRVADTDDAPTSEFALLASEEVEQVVTDAVGGSPLFASRFRECAARALLLPRRNPGKRTPLWQQRQRSAQLLQVASRYGSFPVVLEAMRECLQDVFDVPGLVSLMKDIESRRVRVVEVETQMPSPFARSLLFGYVGAFMYDGDAPLAERRAQALSLDPSLLSELLGRADLRELLDPDAITEVEAQLQWLSDERRARDVETTADLLRVVGDLTTAEAIARGATPQWLAELEETRRAVRVRIAGEERWIAVEDASRVRDALGAPLPLGIAEPLLQSVADPLGDVVGRYARTHTPFHTDDVAARYGLGVAVVDGVLRRLSAEGRVARGEFRPGGAGMEWCDAEVLRLLRRRSLARLRKEIEPAPQRALARFLPQWQFVGSASGRGHDGLLTAIEQLQGAAVPASTLEKLVLPARVSDYSPAMLDELCATGEVIWAGVGSLPGDDGWITLAVSDAAPLVIAPPDESLTRTPVHDAIVDALSGGGAYFFRALSDKARSVDDAALVAALWDLVWAGYVTNDTLAPLRARIGTGRRTTRPRRYAARTSRPLLPTRPGPPAGAGRWALVPTREEDVTRRSYALAESLLERHGVVTRGAVVGERITGGYAAVYPVLKAFEEAGRCQRGYFVDGLGAAQFGLSPAVERLRAAARDDDAHAVVLAATDPANPYGAALPWPERASGTAAAERSGSHRPGRKAGALVVLVDGELVVYVERGGRTLLTFSDEPTRLQPAVDALALAARDGMLGRLAVERADGESVVHTPVADALRNAGFHATPRGLRLRG